MTWAIVKSVMSWLLENWKLVIGCALLGLIAFSVWRWHVNTFNEGVAKGKAEIQAIWDDEEAKEMRQLNDALVENETIKAKLAEDHQNANDALNFIIDHPPAGRVLLPQSKRAADRDPNSPAIGQGDTIQTERTTDPLRQPGADAQGSVEQSALDAFIEEGRKDAAQWARELNSCHELQDWANGLATITMRSGKNAPQ